MPSASENSHDDSLQAYLRSLSRIPELEPDELNHLQRELTRLRTRDVKAWRGLRDRLVLHHQRLVIACAMRFRNGSVPLLDLIQEGNLGLMRAAERFDAERGVLFSSYATWWVRRNILYAVKAQGRTVHVTSHAWALEGRLRKLERDWGARCGGQPAAEEIARELQLEPASVDRLRGLAAGSLCFDQSADPEKSALCETLADSNAVSPDAGVAERWVRRTFARGLAAIDEPARRVLSLRWGLGGTAPLTLKQTGRRLGISAVRVHQIERTARARLRRGPALRELLDLL